MPGQPLAGPLAGPGDIVRVAARKRAGKTALITAAAQFTYAELDDMCAGPPSACTAAVCDPGRL